MIEDMFREAFVGVSPRLAAALDITARNGRARAVNACSALADQLRIDDSTWCAPLLTMLEAMLATLDGELAAGEGSWLDDMETRRARKVAAAALGTLDDAEIVGLVRHLRLDRFHPPLKVETVDGFFRAVRERAVHFIEARVLSMFAEWGRANAWAPELAAGIIPTRRRPA